ncbi:MAG: Clp1/GlmU family protein [Candidatus Bipolaricaulota bacterium]|nr:Clp1/GlmU family protein [Candidatus Bipolaricaulota bacterium]MCS7275264.1 Clp1/GlmU family protein [Candidatus Bipolaricaulota bacterium]MDW8111613.1 Clp1/GlmU family protein [Candidatus Bipolaricaulota bacterium]MDW8328527.1 Clp1/GlmU family protein [Candidatus Bipolaricaulota bacterium]
MIFLGATDTGKTTLVHKLHQQLGGSILDADLGQSTIGPPACVSVGVPGRSDASFFVGDISPRGCWEQVIDGVVYCLHRAERPCLIDTDGYVEGPEARAYKRALVQAVRPDLLVLLPRSKELEDFKNLASRVIEVAAQNVGRKSVTRRIWAREEAFRHYFSQAQRRCWERRGLAVPSTIEPEDLLVGLSWQGHFVGLGVLKALTDEHVEILTPVAQADALELGRLRVREDGSHQRYSLQAHRQLHQRWDRKELDQIEQQDQHQRR